MKHLLLVLGLIVISSFASKGQTADEIINKCLDALGGKDKLASIKSVYEESTVDVRGMPIKVKFWCVQNTAFRQESDINGMKSFSVLRNDSGWFFNPRRGQKQAELMTAENVRRSQISLDIQSPLLNYQKKGYTVKYVGKDDIIDGSDTYKLELKANDSLILTYYVDPDSYFIMRKKTRRIVNGRTDVSIENYSNYQKTADGYIFPMEINRSKYTLIKVNGEVKPILFAYGSK